MSKEHSDKQNLDQSGNCRHLHLDQRDDGSYYCRFEGEKDSPDFIVSVIRRSGEDEAISTV